jgi:hypothetical protein
MRTSEEEAKSIRRVAWRSRELGWWRLHLRSPCFLWFRRINYYEQRIVPRGDKQKQSPWTLPTPDQIYPGFLFVQRNLVGNC